MNRKSKWQEHINVYTNFLTPYNFSCYLLMLSKSHYLIALSYTLLDYSLTNENIPANSLHKKLYEIRQDKDSSQKLRFLAKNWGLIMQVNQECNYCQAFTGKFKD